MPHRRTGSVRKNRGLGLAMALLCLHAFGAESAAGGAGEGVLKVSIRFRDDKPLCQMALTRDSVGILEPDSTAGALEPDDENGFEASIRKRALSAGERDTAGMLMDMARAWTGRKRYVCASPDGYAFTIWSDSLTLHCGNCFSCTEGIGMSEAKTLARFGRLSLWLHRIKGGMDAGTGKAH